MDDGDKRKVGAATAKGEPSIGLTSESCVARQS
jgi:hypothetical protein